MKSTAAVNLLAFVALIFLLKAGAAIFLPFVVALFLWMLIWIVDSSLAPLREKYMPRALGRFSQLFSIAVIIGIFWAVTAAIARELPALSIQLKSYSQSLPRVAAAVRETFGVDVNMPGLAGLEPDMHKMVSRFVMDSAAFVRSLAMVLIYLAFMLMEHGSLRRKLPLIFKSNTKKHAEAMLDKILTKIRAYLFLKSLSSIALGLGAYALMRSVGLEFAGLWAILIAVLNFVPVLGAIVSCGLPILYSLFQFAGGFGPSAILLAGLLALQVFMGNFVEPKILGRNVNISPLVQIFSMVVWGYVWGAVGMFLCIPIMIILSIVLYNIPSTKQWAILMSEDGETI